MGGNAGKMSSSEVLEGGVEKSENSGKQSENEAETEPQKESQEEPQTDAQTMKYAPLTVKDWLTLAGGICGLAAFSVTVLRGVIVKNEKKERANTVP